MAYPAQRSMLEPQEPVTSCLYKEDLVLNFLILPQNPEGE